MTEQEYAENVGKVIEDEPMDRIEEIKELCEKAMVYCNEAMFFYTGETVLLEMRSALEDISFLVAEVERLETMQQKIENSNETIRLDYLDAIAERDAAVNDLKMHGGCVTCKHRIGNPPHELCRSFRWDDDTKYIRCVSYEWRGVQK